MFILSILFFIAFAIFAVLNLISAGAFALGFVILIALWLRRRGEFWPLLFGAMLFCGGAGALGASWGAYCFVASQTSDWGYAVLAWIVAYLIGGIGGALFGAFFVAFKQRRELPDVENQLKSRFRTLKTEFFRLGFRQTLHLGTYALRFEFFKRPTV
ncbi:MAG TPA: hypothetical protein VGB45_09655 [Abditibacterium sp.]|jgi:MFS family permease